MKNLILIAPPAAGKGTLSMKLTSKLGYICLSAGDLLRNISYSNEILDNLMKAGKLIDDEIVFEVVKDAILKLDGKPYILDGFPRTLKQARLYQEFLRENNLPLGLIIYLDIPKEILEKRVSSRIICPNCKAIYSTFDSKFFPKKMGICDHCHHELVKRSDDNIETFDKRYDEYNKNTKPLLDYYRNLGEVFVLTTVDVDDMYSRTLSLLGVD